MAIVYLGNAAPVAADDVLRTPEAATLEANVITNAEGRDSNSEWRRRPSHRGGGRQSAAVDQPCNSPPERCSG